LDIDSWVIGAWMLVTAASATVWTLVAKSTLGATALSTGFHAVIFVAWGRFTEAYHFNSRVLGWTTAAVVLAYSTTMILLGRHMFLRFQSYEGHQTELTLLPGLRLESIATAGWFRCRPQGVILNLIRREIGLLRIVWMLTLVSLAIWIFLAG